MKMDEEIIPEIAMPLRVYVTPTNSHNNKVRKDGTILSYKCRWCTYQSLNLGHTKKHMMACKSQHLI